MARKEKRYHFIYKTTNLLTGRYYIGMHSTDDLNDGYMGSGKRLRYSVNKYGKENHKVEVLEFFKSRDELKKREKEVVTFNEIAKEDCMNLKPGGTGGLSSKKHLNNLRKGASDWMKKKWKEKKFREMHCKLSKKRMKQHHKNGKINYATFTGKNHSVNTKKKMSEKAKLRTGNKNSQFGTCWITLNGINKKIKKEQLPEFISHGWSKGRI